MYNLSKYCDNYSMTLKSLCCYFRGKANDVAKEFIANCRLNNNKTTTSKSFRYKTNIIKKTPGNYNTLRQKLLFH